MRVALACLAVMLSAACTATPAASPSSSAVGTTAAPSATHTLATTSTPGGTRRPSISVKTTAVAAIPKDFAFVESSPGLDVTLWLVDLSRATPPVAVARWTGGNGTYSASRDGKTVVISSPGDRSKYALHLVRPLTGEATVLFDGPPDGRVFFPRLSPDGRSFAFTQQRDSGSDGIWVGDVATGVARQLVPVVGTAPAPVPYDWSEDGQWLAYFNADIGPGQGCCLFVENVVDGRRVRLGVGSVVSWRAQEPRIVASAQTGRGNQGAFGAAVYTFAVALEQRTDLFAVDPRITQLAWNPTKDEFLYLQDTTGCPYASTLWVRARTGDSRRIGALSTVQRAWWSTDGSALYALIHGDGSDGLIVDTATSRSIATIPGDAPTRGCP